MKIFTVTVQAGFGPYEVYCKQGEDLESYLKKLKKNNPYFRLIHIKEKKGDKS